RMGRGGSPDRAAMAHGMDEGAVAARALAEDAPATVPAAGEAPLHEGQHFPDQKGLPGPHGGAVDVLVAAEACEAVGKGDDDRRHRPGADQAVEALGHVLAVVLPVGVAEAAAGIAGEIDEEGKPAPVMTGRDIDVDAAAGGVSE